jgi:hypothetical protein
LCKFGQQASSFARNVTLKKIQRRNQKHRPEAGGTKGEETG